MILPENPFVIGYSPDGVPIWLDPKDYVATLDQNLERKESRERGILEGKTRELCLAIIHGREQWLNDRIIELAPTEVGEAYLSFLKGLGSLPKEPGDSNKPDRSKVNPWEWNRLQGLLARVTSWLNSEGIHCIEDNKDGVFMLVLKRQGEILSRFTWKPVKISNEVASPNAP